VKTYVVLVLAALCGAIGETFFSYGMRRFGEMDWSNPSRWLDLLLVVPRNSHVLMGVVFAAGFFFLYLAALSWVDLSFAMPLTALSFVFAALMSRFVLGEQVSWHRWVGTMVIVAGVTLVALDRNTRTTAPLPNEPGAAAGAQAR
jgi:drug/metabolite transporter (DMT)-like permease